MRNRLTRGYSNANTTPPRPCAMLSILVHLVTGASIIWIGLSQALQSKALE